MKTVYVDTEMCFLIVIIVIIIVVVAIIIIIILLLLSIITTDINRNFIHIVQFDKIGAVYSCIMDVNALH